MSTRYYETPIGAGMSNLAQAIGSLPGRQAQAGLLASRQALVDQQALTEVQQAAAVRELARHRAAQAATEEAELEGRRGMSGVFAPSAPVAPITSAAPVAPVDPSSSMGGGLADIVASVAPALQSSAPPAAVVPSGGLAGAVAPTPAMPGGGTGVTPEMVAKLAQFAALTKKSKPEDLLRMFGGGNLAANETTGDDALSRLQSGAGQAYSGTVRGGKETIKQRADASTASVGQRATAADQASKDRRYNTDVSSGDRRYSADVSSGDRRYKTDNPGPGKGGAGKTRELSTAQIKQVEDRLLEASTSANMRMTPADRAAVVARVGERFAQGELLPSVLEDEAKSMVGDVVPGEKGGWFSKDKPDTRKFKRPDLEGTRAKPAPGAAPVAKLPAGAKQIGTSKGKPVYETPDGKRFIGD